MCKIHSTIPGSWEWVAISATVSWCLYRPSVVYTLDGHNVSLLTTQVDRESFPTQHHSHTHPHMRTSLSPTVTSVHKVVIPPFGRASQMMLNSHVVGDFSQMYGICKRQVRNWTLVIPPSAICHCPASETMKLSSSISMKSCMICPSIGVWLKHTVSSGKNQSYFGMGDGYFSHASRRCKPSSACGRQLNSGLLHSALSSVIHWLST
jgi:hypothetical protein